LLSWSVRKLKRKKFAEQSQDLLAIITTH
jgi:hypothetical protein